MNMSALRTSATAVPMALAVGYALHLTNAGPAADVSSSPALPWIHAALLAVPIAAAAVVIATVVVTRLGLHGDRWLGRLSWALTAGLVYAVVSAPGRFVYERLVGSAHPGAMLSRAALVQSAVVLGAAVATVGIIAALAGGPAEPAPLDAGGIAPWLAGGAWRIAPVAVIVALLGGTTIAIGSTLAPAGPPAPGCAAFAGTRTIVADVVAIDQPLVFNRLGAANPEGMIYALRRDIVPAVGNVLGPGNAVLRAGKRPRPLVLRVDVGDCLLIHFQNLLSPVATVGQPADRHVGIHVNGMQLADPDGPGPLRAIDSDGSYVGRNPSSLVASGQRHDYLLFAEYENTYLMSSLGATAGGEGNGGTISEGLFGAVDVEPVGSDWYRSQVSRADMELATPAETFTDTNGNGRWDDGEPLDDTNGDGRWNAHRATADGQPILDYEATYPLDPTRLTEAGVDPQLAGAPILRIADDSGEIVHSDLNAVIAGPAANDYRIPHQAYPDGYWANQVYNAEADRGSEPFREFTIIFHDETEAQQAFPDFYDDPALQHTLHGVGDAFGINYGIAGVGSEVIANRLGLGPMWHCTDCKFEEFFLSSWTVGDPAMIVDRPANAVRDLRAGGPGGIDPRARATRVLYPDDPSNVDHSYLNDRVKFRNLHAGPKEHHIFHLHAHQWQFDPNTEKSSYLDSQDIGPGGGYTYEIAYGGSGNRNKTLGDAIFHCHFYPHFAQGMWALWRTHDAFEPGTQLDAGGKPVPGARALPDGEITAGTPIPAVVPLPGRPMAPVSPAPSAVVPYDLNQDGVMDSSQLDVDGDGRADMDEGFATATALVAPAAAGTTGLTVVSSTGMRAGVSLSIGADAPETVKVAGISGDAVTLARPLAADHAAGEPVTRTDNPGYPFFIPAVAGHRPPTPPLDLKDDGGLPRHVITGGTAEQFQTRLDFDKTLKTAQVAYIPEEGAGAEKAAMAFHHDWWHPTYTTAGTAVNAAQPLISGGRPLQGFETNGLAGAHGAPFSNPCRTDATRANGWAAPSPTGTPRRYQAAAVQLDLTLNKVGWHFPQQRIEVLNDDVAPTLAGTRAAQPLVMRLGVGDCATYEQTNLLPNVYQLDDYQVRTPTDVIGQHIHLVKFDVLAADGSGNGFNYEDGTLSPQEVQERVTAIRAGNSCPADPGAPGRLDAGETPTPACPLARKHPVFGATPGVGDLAWGARTTYQRWYADAILNNAWDRGLGSVFTHDHFGPSSHQQVGLYATVLVEPEGSQWSDPETGVAYGSRADGGPTSWRSDVTWPAGDARNAKAHREYYLEISDFQHAYQKGAATTPKPRDNESGTGTSIPSFADFANAVNPSFRIEPTPGNERSLYLFPPYCPHVVGAAPGDIGAGAGDPAGGTQVNDLARPCPEAISAADPGTYVVNYRNEPLGLRVFDPATKGQATGAAGDLALAMTSRADRAIAALDKQPAGPALTADVQPGDPYTPLLRAYQGDRVRIRLQVGATEEEHTFTAGGLRWLQEPMDPASGWRASQAMGISEYFVADTPIVPDLSTGRSIKSVDYPYEIGSATEDLWNGNWGLIRAYGQRRADLRSLPNNAIPASGWKIANQASFDHACPTTVNGVRTRYRAYDVTAVRAIDVLGPDGLVYNGRNGGRRLIDPTALLYVFTEDVVRNPATLKPIGLRPGTPVEPLVLRAAAGECIKVRLQNALPATVFTAAQNLPGFNALPPIIVKGTVDVGSAFGPGLVTFNQNDLMPSSRVGLQPQLVSFDGRRDAGVAVGANGGVSLVPPGGTGQYTWYAGALDLKPDPADPANRRLVTAAPVEYGVANLMPADRIMGTDKGLGGALVIEPPGATWATDPGSRTSATVTFPAGTGTTAVREFVAVLQDDINLRYAGGCVPSGANLGCAVGNIHSEGAGFPEDAQDAGQKAIDYRSDPIWFRLGIPPETDFRLPLLRDNLDMSRAFSNDLVGGDPAAPIFQASTAAGAPLPVRVRVAEPGGHARGHEITISGHPWQRAPYVQTGTVPSDRLTWSFAADPTDRGGPAASGANPASWWITSQESISGGSHFDLQTPKRGGLFGAEGDFLLRDSASFGGYQGLWGLLRVGSSPALAAPDRFSARSAATLVVTAANGVLKNDVDLDGDPIAVAQAGGAAVGTTFKTAQGGLALVRADGSFTYTPPPLFAGTDTFPYTLVGGRSATVTIVIRSAAPVLASDWAAVGVNPAIGQSVAIPVLANDVDSDGALKLVSDPATGAVTVTRPVGAAASATITADATGRGIVYTPVSPFVFGNDLFTYAADDGTGNVSTGTVRVTVIIADVGALTLGRLEWSKAAKRWTISGTVAGSMAATWPTAIEMRVSGKLIARVPLTPPAASVDAPAAQDYAFVGAGGVGPSPCSSDVVTVQSMFGTATGATIVNVPITCTP